jgi:hypothetical protein
VPNVAMQVALVSQNDKHLLAFGCQPYAGSSTDYDPLLIRWASQDEPQYWNPTGTTPGGSTSSAGFLRVSRGSEIVRALPTRQEILVWTDTTLYSLQYLGTTDVFALQQLADNISIISPRAAATQPTTLRTGWEQISFTPIPDKFKHCQQPFESTFTKILITLRPIKLLRALTKGLMKSGGSTPALTPTGITGMWYLII